MPAHGLSKFHLCRRQRRITATCASEVPLWRRFEAAAYDASVDTYRQTTLTAFQEVEDNLSALRVLQGEAATQQGAVAAAEHSLALSNSRYKGGVANYLEVTTAQSAALVDERAALDILTRRMTASVLLIKALGGGWNVSQIPAL